MTTYYVDGAVGNDTNAGTSEGAGNAWATIDKAASTVAAADTVYVKASATYSEQVTLDTAGTDGNIIRWIGYTSTTGDNGKVTIDSPSNYAVDGASFGAYHSWRNFIFTGGSSNGYNAGNSDNCSFYNCEFTNNGAAGIFGDNFFAFVNCEFTNNGGRGCDCDSTLTFVGCIFSGNAAEGAGGYTASKFYKCLWFNNSLTTDVLPSSFSDLIACTVDGDGTSGDGLGDANAAQILVVDNIIHDVGGAGVTNPVAQAHSFFGYNLFSNVTGSLYSVDRDTTYGQITGYQDPAEQDPSFVDEASDDYRVQQSSPAVGAGLKPGGIT